MPDLPSLTAAARSRSIALPSAFLSIRPSRVIAPWPHVSESSHCSASSAWCFGFLVFWFFAGDAGVDDALGTTVKLATARSTSSGLVIMSRPRSMPTD